MSIMLCAISRAELERLAASCLPPELASLAAGDAVPPPFVAKRALEQLDEGKWVDRAFTFYVVRRADRCIVGACGFKDVPTDGRVEIGYAVSSCCQNQGIATAAIGQLTALAFRDFGAVEVLAQIDPANTASTRVVQKLGFDNVGTAIDDIDNEILVQWVLRTQHPAAPGANGIGAPA
jgi:[ribosomal protein S5]-alanine N-acetyltransferase